MILLAAINLLPFIEVCAIGLDYSHCATDAIKTYNQEPNKTFLYNRHGHPTGNRSEAWGISYDSCTKLCHGPANGRFYSWNSLFQGLQSWFLPWFALTAQLPFGTKQKRSDFMVLLLALGSPALISHSLALTISNTRTINKRFRQIVECC